MTSTTTQQINADLLACFEIIKYVSIQFTASFERSEQNEKRFKLFMIKRIYGNVFLCNERLQKKSQKCSRTYVSPNWALKFLLSLISLCLMHDVLLIKKISTPNATNKVQWMKAKTTVGKSANKTLCTNQITASIHSYLMYSTFFFLRCT